MSNVTSLGDENHLRGQIHNEQSNREEEHMLARRPGHGGFKRIYRYDSSLHSLVTRGREPQAPAIAPLATTSEGEHTSNCPNSLFFYFQCRRLTTVVDYFLGVMPLLRYTQKISRGSPEEFRGLVADSGKIPKYHANSSFLF